MSGLTPERPEPLLRLDEVAGALEDLRAEVAGEEPLDAVLLRLAETAVKGISDADAVSVTVLADGGPRTAASTDSEMIGIDGAQYTAESGPALHAATTREPVRSVVADDEERWPEFVKAALATGVRAYLSMPLLLESAHDGEPELVGALNVYSRTATAFDPFDETLMRLFTNTASAAISNARRWHHARDRVRHLEVALTSRAEIDQAKGVLMAVHGVSAEDAFARLVEQSQQQNRKLREVARELLESVRHR
ncbi:GAF and ANTAR domain-containing protein [Amycolatopsis acidicola]|uniref:GAF and ANTAR domain-containing protein n=1 Tax=Amycolatopsis acidicola TaxID=2596893 RepID=A0A5N0V9Y7_9PSEU|nr:GAF and ANTAR domain-containing protein [Amycolatopsis acidicola]KAA9161352.1 GAF and ANTAR domain-containing protein [Amycolatopsis acidicola]